jgi:predicted permease
MKRWTKRLRLLLHKSAVERDLNEELAFHIAMETEKNLRAGMSPDEARRQAAIAFGGVERHKEEVRAARMLGWVAGLSLDFTLGVRMLRKYPGLTIVGGLAIAFAIWAGATGYEVVARVLYRPLPFVEAERIVTIGNWDAARSRLEQPSLHDYTSWRNQVPSVEDLGAIRTSQRNLIGDDGRVAVVRVAEITASALRVPRMPPILGRPIVEEDERPGAPPVVVLLHSSWRERFHSDSAIIGRPIRLGQTFHTVIGVVPSGIDFLVGGAFLVPLRLNPAHYRESQSPQVKVIGRLATGATLDDAQAELTRLASRDAGTATAPAPTTEQLRPRVEQYARTNAILSPIQILAINIFLILLLTLICGNVALLMFARAATREGEIAVRHALGASRMRIIAQLFAEALVLAMVAAAVGLVVTDLGVRWRYGFFGVVGVNEVTPFWERDGVSATTMLYAALLAVLAAGVAGVVPALKITRGLEGRLRRSGAGGGGFRFGGFWTAVIVAQVAAMVALPPVAYYLRGEEVAMRDADPGFPAAEFLSVRLELDRETESGAARDTSPAAYATRFGAAYRQLEARLEADPVVAGVTFAERLSVTGGSTRRIELEGGAMAGIPDSASDQQRAKSTGVAIDYFSLMNAPVLQGRAFHAADAQPAADVVIVNQRFVAHVLGGRNPIGQRFRYVPPVQSGNATPASEPWYTIIGVVRDIGTPSAGEVRERSEIYHALAPGGAIPTYVAVHLREAPERWMPRLAAIAASVDPTLRVLDPIRMDRIHDEDLYVFRALFWLITAVSGGAMLLSMAGIHAVLSFTVTQRRREIGIRLALGGRARRVAVTVVRRPLRQVAVGVVAGAILTAYSLYIMKNAVTIGGVARMLAYVAVMVGVCVVATIVPARRALQVQPGEAMKAE